VTISLIRGLCLWMLLLIVPQLAAAVTDPLNLVRDTSERCLSEIINRKAELTETPGKIYSLVDDIVLPSFDFERMSRLVLGKFWRQASEQEKQDFVREFRQMLVRTYGTALLQFSGQEIKYLPMRLAPDATDVTVNTEVKNPGAPPVPINYSLYLAADDWKVYDVSIDGVSLVSNYRNSFNAQIRRYTLAGLIGKLADRNREGQ
jgi:phospholipid transport system substrate-binding protein